MKMTQIMITALILASYNFAGASGVAGEIEKVMAKYDECTGQGYDAKSFKKFKMMVSKMKSEQQKSMRSNFEVTNFGHYNITILDHKNKKECVLNIEPYDGRCVYATCN